MSYPTITDLPSAPSRGSAPTTFRDDMDAFLAALPGMVTEQNAAGAWIESTAADVETDAATASAAAASAVAASGAAIWVSGTTYAAGDVRWSPINFKSYRRKTNGAGTTDPSADSTNWALLAGQGEVLALNGTLTTPTITTPTWVGTPIEDIFTITDGASVDIDPANGSIQIWTLGASRTPTATNLQNGQSVELLIADGTAYSVTWSTIGVVWADGIAPTLPTTGYARILLSKAGGVVRGAWIGNYAS